MISRGRLPPNAHVMRKAPNPIVSTVKAIQTWISSSGHVRA